MDSVVIDSSVKTPIYLDHNSTTPILPEVAEAMMEVYRAGYVNPASQHQLGQKARRLLEETREAILALLGGKTSGMDADRLIFTSGGTEANNLAIRGLAGEPPGRIVVSSIEHVSIAGAAEFLAAQRHQVERIAVLPSGCIDLAHAEALLAQRPSAALACVMLANNETGVVQPIAPLQALCQRHETPLLIDAAQAIGKIDVSFRKLGVAAMSIAPHKFHGPLGIGALILRSNLSLEPLAFGGFQQAGLRPGTESVALAVGLRVALQAAVVDLEKRRALLAESRDRFEQLLTAELGDSIHVNCRDAERLPNTSNIAFLGLDRQELLLALDAAGVCCSTGSACASGSSEPSPVLVAMGLEKERVESSLRFSFGITNTPAEAAEAARRIINVVNDLRARKLGRKSATAPRQQG